MNADISNDPLLRDAPLVEGFRVLDPCVLYARLGQGGMGAVYRGRHLNLDIDVAVKCLHESLAHGEEYVVRFEREARLAAAIQHDNLIRVFDVKHLGPLRYLVMELVVGENARERVRRKGRLAVDEAVAIVLAAARGLGKAHEAGVVHRDIKPDNILISMRGEVKVADLGLAKGSEPGSTVTVTNQVMGTPQYMAPEQWEDTRSVGPAADVWSLGATLWFLLAGQDPIRAGSIPEVSRRVLLEPFPDVRAQVPDVPEAVAGVLARCVARDPAQRFADARAFAGDLARAVGHDTAVPADPQARTGPTGTLVSPPPGATLARIRSAVTSSLGREAAAGTGRSPSGPTLVAGPADETGSGPDDAVVSPMPVRTRSRVWSWLSGGVSVAAILLFVAHQFGLVERVVRRFFGRPPGAQMPHMPGPRADRPGDIRVAANPPKIEWVEPWFSEDSADALTVVRVRVQASVLGSPKVRINGVEAVAEPDHVFARKLPLAQFGGQVVADVTDAIKGFAAAPARSLPTQLANPWPGTKVADPAWVWFDGRSYPAQLVDPASDVRFVLIPSGQFQIGSPDGTGDDDEHPQRTIMMSKPYYLGRTEVTVAQWKRFVAATRHRTAAEKAGDSLRWQAPAPGIVMSDDLPVSQVTWEDATAFCRHFGYELPFESHWEYAARAGATTRYWWGDDVKGAAGKANVWDLDGAATVKREASPVAIRDGYALLAPVARFAPNAFGLFDVAGNVREWCRNGPCAYGSVTLFNEALVAKDRMTRGGSYAVAPDLCRVAARFPLDRATYSADIGFRVMKQP